MKLVLLFCYLSYVSSEGYDTFDPNDKWYFSSEPRDRNSVQFLEKFGNGSKYLPESYRNTALRFDSGKDSSMPDAFNNPSKIVKSDYSDDERKLLSQLVKLNKMYQRRHSSEAVQAEFDREPAPKATKRNGVEDNDGVEFTVEITPTSSSRLPLNVSCPSQWATSDWSVCVYKVVLPGVYSKNLTFSNAYVHKETVQYLTTEQPALNGDQICGEYEIYEFEDNSYMKIKDQRRSSVRADQNCHCHSRKLPERSDISFGVFCTKTQTTMASARLLSSTKPQ